VLAESSVRCNNKHAALLLHPVDSSSFNCSDQSSEDLKTSQVAFLKLNSGNHLKERNVQSITN
jgi:hypothetical protein